MNFLHQKIRMDNATKSEHSEEMLRLYKEVQTLKEEDKERMKNTTLSKVGKRLLLLKGDFLPFQDWDL
jgi:hypothetical protein